MLEEIVAACRTGPRELAEEFWLPELVECFSDFAPRRTWTSAARTTVCCRRWELLDADPSTSGGAGVGGREGMGTGARHIEGRKPTEYDVAVAILTDLQMISEERGTAAEFDRRLASLRLDHVRKPTLQARLDAAGLIPGIPATH